MTRCRFGSASTSSLAPSGVPDAGSCSTVDSLRIQFLAGSTIDTHESSFRKQQAYAVLSIGGFLGMGTHMVVVRYDSLKGASNNWRLRRAVRISFVRT